MDKPTILLAAAFVLLILAIVCSAKKESFGLTPYLSCVVDCQTNGNRPGVIMDDGDYPSTYCVEQCEAKYGGVSTLL